MRNYACKSNCNIALQTHKKLDNDTLNVYYGVVSAQQFFIELRRRLQERIP
jgi:hypothetical protein